MTVKELPDVMDAIAAIQEAITPPSGERPPVVYDEPPGGVMQTPCWLNIEELGEPVRFDASHRHLVMHVNMHLLFAPATQKYAVRSRRRWLKPVLDAFNSNVRLQDTCNHSRFEEISFEPVIVGETPYVAATFVLRVDMSDAFAAAP